MCERFTSFCSPRELQKHFEASLPSFEILPNFNVAPTQQILAVTQQVNERKIDRFHWGLVPFWAKDTSIGSKMINARLETVASKPAFRSAFKQRRCLIPANGFYEWQGKSGEKQPYFFFLPSKEPFAFAGLWEVWEDKNAPSSAPYMSCTIITTSASESVSDVHDRMPLILKPDTYSRWLNPEYKEPDFVLDILKKGALTELERYPVSKLVNRVGNNREQCMEPNNNLSLVRADASVIEPE